jgi:hypothetical protein
VAKILFRAIFAIVLITTGIGTAAVLFSIFVAVRWNQSISSGGYNAVDLQGGVIEFINDPDGVPGWIGLRTDFLDKDNRGFVMIFPTRLEGESVYWPVSVRYVTAFRNSPTRCNVRILLWPWLLLGVMACTTLGICLMKNRRSFLECIRCRYDLSGLQGIKKCPECGYLNTNLSGRRVAPKP